MSGVEGITPAGSASVSAIAASLDDRGMEKSASGTADRRLAASIGARVKSGGAFSRAAGEAGGIETSQSDRIRSMAVTEVLVLARRV